MTIEKPIYEWPPPSEASGCVEALAPDGEWHRVNRYHYVDERGSLWGYTTETYRTHGRQTTLHPSFSHWRWVGPTVPTREEQGKAIFVWQFRHAPGELQALSTNGGDEDWLALLPDDCVPDWMDDGTGFGVCRSATYRLDDVRTVVIGCHA